VHQKARAIRFFFEQAVRQIQGTQALFAGQGIFNLAQVIDDFRATAELDFFYRCRKGTADRRRAT